MRESFQKGVYPVMLTPFTEENRIDEDALGKLTEWYIENGAAGLFAVCQSSEMFFLSLKERMRAARYIKKCAGNRVSVIASGHVSESMEEQAEEIAKLMKKILKKDAIKVKIEKLKNKKISSMITLSEESRRMQDMMKMYSMPGMGMGDFGKEGETLVLNANHPLVQHIMENTDGKNVNMICEQLYDLALLQHAPLEPEAMSRFVARSNDIMMLLTK